MKTHTTAWHATSRHDSTLTPHSAAWSPRNSCSRPLTSALISTGLAFGLLLIAAVVQAHRGDPPRSATAKLMPAAQVMALELEPIAPETLLREDTAADPGGPLRYAVPADMDVTPDRYGTWETLANGGRVWRLRVYAPMATDLSFGFTRFKLPEGATLHVLQEGNTLYQGPYTAHHQQKTGELWTAAVLGERAILELYVPPETKQEPELRLGRVLRGYRGIFDPEPRAKQGSCNIDVVCPEGDGWRNQIRSVARYTMPTGHLCTGTLIMDVPRDFRNFFLTAHHCPVSESTAPGVVVYWNFESPVCGQLSGGSLTDNQTGATYLAGRTDNDFSLIELDEDPDPAYNVFYSGWDASTNIPQSSTAIHHPNGDEKAITFNDDPLTTGQTCLNNASTPDTHWFVDNWEQGTTEPGSSGCGLFDPSSHLLVGYLSGGLASCTVLDFDCFGRLAIGWNGDGPQTRLRDWLDPGNTGTLQVEGADPAPVIRYASHTGTDVCSSGGGDHNGLWEPGELIELEVELAASGSFTGVQGTLTTTTPGVSILNGNATWPDVDSSSTVLSDNPHLSLLLSPGIGCGGTVDLSLTVTANEGGPFTLSFSNLVGEDSGGPALVAIRDLTTVQSDIEVSDDVVIEDLDVAVAIQHSWVGDLQLELVSPLGSRIQLLDRPDYPAASLGCSDNDMTVVFDDEASTDLEDHCEGTSPWYSGRALPTESLSVVDGFAATGTWSLLITDNAGGDTGSLLGWELQSTPPIVPACNICGGPPRNATGRRAPVGSGKALEPALR